MRVKFNVYIERSQTAPWNVEEAQYPDEYGKFQSMLSPYFDSRGIDVKSHSAEPNKKGLMVSLGGNKSEEALAEALASFLKYVHDLPRSSAYRPTFFLKKQLAE